VFLLADCNAYQQVFGATEIPGHAAYHGQLSKPGVLCQYGEYLKLRLDAPGSYSNA
jgi:hypothetical protein